jgi:3-phenylpropionate/trans-cinnamate dioxygenase ferredoxin reductase subunit
VILGAGQAGAQAAISLRGEGFAGRILLLGEEAWPPYERPPLSKALLAGSVAEERLFLRRPEFYAERGIELRTGTPVAAIDRAAGEVVLRDGARLGYDRLLIATGAPARPLPAPGADGVLTLRTLDDARALRARLVPGLRVAIIGAGYIGLEVAATAARSGAAVAVIEAAERVMQRVASPPISAFFDRAHRAAGVDLRLRDGVVAIEPAGPRLADGSILLADLVIAGIGVAPADQLARAAGLDCADGILTDADGRTSDPAIFAAGDVARQAQPNGGHLRLEAVSTAIAQAKAAARAMLGLPPPPREVPWFWSDQYEHKLQMVGLPMPDDDLLLRGDPEGGKFAVLHLRDGVLTAVETVSSPRDFMAAKRLIAAGARPDPRRAADPAVPLAESG